MAQQRRAFVAPVRWFVALLLLLSALTARCSYCGGRRSISPSALVLAVLCSAGCLAPLVMMQSGVAAVWAQLAWIYRKLCCCCGGGGKKSKKKAASLYTVTSFNTPEKTPKQNKKRQKKQKTQERNQWGQIVIPPPTLLERLAVFLKVRSADRPDSCPLPRVNPPYSCKQPALLRLTCSRVSQGAASAAARLPAVLSALDRGLCGGCGVLAGWRGVYAAVLPPRGDLRAAGKAPCYVWLISLCAMVKFALDVLTPSFRASASFSFVQSVRFSLTPLLPLLTECFLSDTSFLSFCRAASRCGARPRWRRCSSPSTACCSSCLFWSSQSRCCDRRRRTGLPPAALIAYRRQEAPRRAPRWPRCR